MVNADHTLVQRPLYYTRMAALPDDADELHFMAMRHTVSYDGGASFELSGGGGDFHDIWIDPEMSDRMIMGHDQGISISTNRGETWMRPQLPVAQMYHVYTDTRVPYFLYGNRQDGPSFRGPSNSRTGGLASRTPQAATSTRNNAAASTACASWCINRCGSSSVVPRWFAIVPSAQRWQSRAIVAIVAHSSIRLC